MPNLSIPGFSESNLVPIYAGQVVFGASGIRFGSQPVKVLLVGLSAGTLALDGQVMRCLSKEDADTLCSDGTELATMAYDFLDEVAGFGGYELYLASPTGAGGATAATLTITVTGTASAAGTVKIWVRGQLTEVNIPNGTLQNASAALIEAAMDLASRSAVTAGVATNVVTLTVKSAGIRGNQHVCYVDFSGAPGITIALGGAGSATTSSTTLVGRFFGGGTGTETLTTILTNLFPTFHKFQVWAPNDATSLAALELQCDAKAGPTEGKKEHYVVSNNGNFAAATSVAQTTLNNARFSLKWLELDEQYPACKSAAVAAYRAVTEQGSTVNSGNIYDGHAYRTMKPQRFPADWVTSYAEKQAALSVGVSPLETKADGKVYEVRSITTKCLDGAVADRRTVDTSDSYCADYANERAELVYVFEYRIANPYVAPDPAEDEADRPEGVGTPSGWNARLNAENQQMEKERILTQTVLNPPSSEFNYTANRIMTAHPVVVLP